MMWCIGVIAWNTFRETLRDKILYNLLFFALLLIGVSVLLGDLSIMEQKKIVTDLGLASISVVGVIISIFVGIGLVTKEIDRRTIYTIMARPITRVQFILGKYLGLSLTLLVNVTIMVVMFSATLWMDRVPITLVHFQALELIFIEWLIVTALALLFSTFSSSTLSAILTLAFFVIGHLAADLKGIAAKSEHEALKLVMSGVYYIVPNLEMLNIKGQASHGVPVELSFLVSATTYGILYAAFVISAACLIFSRRDF